MGVNAAQQLWIKHHFIQHFLSWLLLKSLTGCMSIMRNSEFSYLNVFLQNLYWRWLVYYPSSIAFLNLGCGSKHHLHSCYSKFLVCMLPFSSKTTELIQLNFWGASSCLGNIFGQNIYSSRFLFSWNPKKQF